MNTVPEWENARDAWAKFCEGEGKHLGLKGNENGWAYFKGKHLEALKARGIISRGPQKKLLVKADAFAAACLELLIVEMDAKGEEAGYVMEE